ncbi:substrate-binding periplasmic protein [Pseudomaricurvus sp.]|uniref:substrate-binding periplasmic protein n=1 Tax=Pseudomaricurvus sp. TaxID=2004510 RepID=UPI003F6AD4A4
MKQWLFAGLWLMWSGVCSAETLVIYGDDHNPPKISVTSAGSANGILVDMMERVGERIGQTFEFRLLPWKRAYHEAVVQGAGLILGVSWSTARESMLDYSEPLFTDRLMLFVRQGERFDYQGVSSLRGKRVGVKLGVFYGEDLERQVARRELQVAVAPTQKHLLRMLLQQRIDVAIIGPEATTGWNLIDADPVLQARKQEISVLAEPFQMDVNYLGLPKNLDMTQQKREDLLEAINQALSDLRADGTMQEIVTHHGL